jgi:phosphatidate phosphatase LPIN
MEQARPPGYNDNEEEKIGSSVNRSLIQEFNAIEEKVANEEETADKQQTAAIPESASTSSLNCKGKQNRKKRKRRNKGHARNGSKSSLKDVAALATASSSESGEGGKQEIVATAEDKELFEMEDNDNDGDCDDDENESTPINSVVVASTPIKTNKTADSTEQSFLQSRLGNSAFDSLLDSQEHMHREEKESRATAATMDYFSEPEMTSPQGSRPPTPVQSDTEYETKREKKKSAVAGEQSWEWGKLPMSAKDAAAKDAAAKDEKDGQKSEEDGATKINVDSTDGAAGGSKRRWTFSSFWKSGENNSKNRDRRQVGVPGVYLDDLKDDEEMMAIYVGSVGRRTSENNPLLPYDDDDAESGTGASLPMSPHSVDGAIGGARLMAPGSAPKGHYDSSDDEQRAAKHIFSEIALSLCGGLDQPDKEFSPLLFEQGLLSYDDYVLRLRDTDLFTHPDLVVRIGNKYYTWQAASPIIMSVALYGQKLPNELVEDKESKAGASSSSPSSGSKQPPSRSSSWWPFGSRKPDGRGAGGEPRIPEGEDLEAGVSQTDAAAPMSIAPPVSLEAVTEAEGQADKLIGEAVNNAAAAAVTTTTTSGESRSRTRFDTSGSTTGSEGDHELKLKIKRKEKKYKKTLRLSSDQIVKLNLKPGANEAQFSVTTAYQGTSRCNCHIYWWKHTDKIVVSDIDGTITKSDVLGHVMPIIGRDWAQSGVASLFTKIVANSYQIIYLSSRAIGQAGITKDYLATIRQGDVNLPDGPLFLNPTSLVNAFHREVIEKKPEKFKIACLRDIQKLFPSNPLYAGYGNRVNVSCIISKLFYP